VGLISRILGKQDGVRRPGCQQVFDGPGAALSKSFNRFAIDAYGDLSAEDSKSNLLLSPFSIASALAMVLTGARGSTAKQLADVLHLDGLGDRLQHEYCAIRTLQERVDTCEKTDFRIANGLWGHNAYEFAESYRADVRDIFGGVIRDVDFRSDAESVRREVNDWVAQVTNDKIQNLLEPDSVDELTRLIVVNALYFQDKWLDNFKPEKTSDELFTLLDGQRVETPMMHQTKHFAYAETIGEQVLTIPYKSGYNMTVVLPKKKSGIAGLEKKLRTGADRPWEKPMRSREVVLTLPKFKIETRAVLSSWLRNMGVTEIFDSSTADLSGMGKHVSPGQSEPLFIGEVYHRTFIRVDETGTEAAAATAAVAPASALGRPPKPVIFTADHPFVFLIRTSKTGLILFMGRVTDPTK